MCKWFCLFILHVRLRQHIFNGCFWHKNYNYTSFTFSIQTCIIYIFYAYKVKNDYLPVNAQHCVRAIGCCFLIFELTISTMSYQYVHLNYDHCQLQCSVVCLRCRRITVSVRAPPVENGSKTATV